MCAWELWYRLISIIRLSTVLAIQFACMHVFCQVFLPDKNESGDRTWDLLSVIVSLFFDTRCLLPHELAAPPCTRSWPKSKNSKPSSARTLASSATSSTKELIADMSRPTSSGANSARQTEEQSGEKFGLTNTAQLCQAQGHQGQGGHGQLQWMEYMTDLPSLPQHMPSNDSQQTDGLRVESFLVHMARCTTQPPRPRSAPAAPLSHATSPYLSCPLTPTPDKHAVYTFTTRNATDPDMTDV